MRHMLRRATASAHLALDAALGSLDLSNRDGYARFLRAHAIGLVPLDRTFRRFVESGLGLAAPNYLRQLIDDLAVLGIDASGLPRVTVAPDLAPAGVAYVIAGSRLGIASIRKQPNWGSRNAMAQNYLDDTAGPGVWRALMAWMANQPDDPDQAGALVESADAAFGAFAAGYALSVDQVPHR